MLGLDEWFAGGKRIPITLSTPPSIIPATFEIFCRVEGEGPWLTLLHGFPTCSWDWVQVQNALRPHYRLLIFDFLGYGNSDKPKRHAYSSFEHADITQALWAYFGIEATGIVAHDVGTTVTQELLARQIEGRLRTRITGSVLMNGAVYTDHYRPVFITQLMRQPVIGPLVAGALTEKTFSRSLAALFSKAHPISADELHQYWRAVQLRQGVQNFPRLLHYLPEKKIHKNRWEGALNRQQGHARFLWGMADPATGAPIARDIGQRHPSENLIALPEVGHFPQREVPERAAAEILKAFAAWSLTSQFVAAGRQVV